MKIRLCCLSATLLVQGCVSATKYEFDIAPPSTALHLIDNRTARDKDRTNTCENGGIGNLGDANIVPDKMTLLASRMAVGGRLPAGTEVKVEKFNLYVVYPNTCVNLTRSAQASAVAGVTGGSVVLTYSQTKANGEGVACQLEFERDRNKYSGKSFVEAQEGIKALTGYSASTQLLISPLLSAVDKCIADALGKTGAPPAH